LAFLKPVAMLCVTDTSSELDGWIADGVRRMKDAAISVAKRSETPGTASGDLALVFAGLATFTEEETRSLDEYMEEVDGWARTARAALGPYVRDRAPRVSQTPPLRPILANATDRNFKDVRVEVHAEGRVTGHLPRRTGREPATLPDRPRSFG